MSNIYGIKIGQYDTEGKLIKEYPSLYDAAREVGYKSKVSISNILDTSRLGKGYYWKKLSDANKKPQINIENCIKVNKYTLDGTFVEQFESYTHATRSLNIKSESCVRRVIESGKYTEDSFGNVSRKKYLKMYQHKYVGG